LRSWLFLARGFTGATHNEMVMKDRNRAVIAMHRHAYGHHTETAYGILATVLDITADINPLAFQLLLTMPFGVNRPRSCPLEKAASNAKADWRVASSPRSPEDCDAKFYSDHCATWLLKTQ
jgi:hypothetical protein